MNNFILTLNKIKKKFRIFMYIFTFYITFYLKPSFRRGKMIEPSTCSFYHPSFCQNCPAWRHTCRNLHGFLQYFLNKFFKCFTITRVSTYALKGWIFNRFIKPPRTLQQCHGYWPRGPSHAKYAPGCP